MFGSVLGHCSVLMRSGSFSWQNSSDRPSLRNIDFEVKFGENSVICGEVVSGKSTLIGAVLADVPMREGKIKVSWRIVRVPERHGSRREPWDNILFGSAMDDQRNMLFEL